MLWKRWIHRSLVLTSFTAICICKRVCCSRSFVFSWIVCAFLTFDCFFQCPTLVLMRMEAALISALQRVMAHLAAPAPSTWCCFLIFCTVEVNGPHSCRSWGSQFWLPQALYTKSGCHLLIWSNIGWCDQKLISLQLFICLFISSCASHNSRSLV